MLDELSVVAAPSPTGLTLRAALPSLANLQPIAVTPLTEMAASLAGGATGGFTAANINTAATAVNSAFLGGASALNTQPIDVRNYGTATVEKQQLSKLLVALAVAADQGIATDATGKPCDSTVGDYGQRMVCMIGGLGKLITLAGNTATLQQDANYIAAAYTQINEGNVTVAGGQAPSALGLTTPTNAETAFITAVNTQATLPGYDPSAPPLPNTKALFADIRTNIIDQSTTKTFGLAPVAMAVANDFATNVRPVLQNGDDALRAMIIAADLLMASHTDPAAGEPTSLVGPLGIVGAPDGNLYVSGASANVILRITPAGVITPLAGLAGVPGSADGTGADARFTTPCGLAVDAAGNIYVADQANHVIRKVTPAGVVTTVAGQAGSPGNVNGVGSAAKFNLPFGLAIDSGGNLYVSEFGNPTQVRKIAPDGTVTTFATGVANFTAGLAVDSAGNVYASDIASPRIRKITPAGVVSTLAGAGVPGSSDGTGLQAGFRTPLGLAVDTVGNVYVADTGNNEIRVVFPNGVVASIAGLTQIPGDDDGAAGARFRGPGALVVTNTGLYVSDGGNNSIRRIVPGPVVSTLAHGAAVYRNSGVVVCGFDPPRLSGGQKNVALCRYGGVADPILLTLTETAAGTYGVTTQPLAGVFNPTPPIGSNPVLLAYTRSTTIPALDAAFTVASGPGNQLAATATGPLYVKANGGRVDSAINLVALDGWDVDAGSGTLTLAGSLSNGSGGIALSSAAFGPQSSLVLTNLGALDGVPLPPGADLPSASATLSLNATTNAFSYGATFTVGAPVADKSGTVGVPGSVSLSGSVAAIGAGGQTTPVFTGGIGVTLRDIGLYDDTLPLSASNSLDTQLQIDGKLALTGGRELSVLATFKGKQDVPTPDAPFSAAVTYSYVTPKGTAQLNATAQYDTTNGMTATLTNNAGVTMLLAQPADTRGVAGLTGSVTDNNVATATVVGGTINYSDGTTESLF
jgi:sugar lactone lactonase YvrE